MSASAVDRYVDSDVLVWCCLRNDAGSPRTGEYRVVLVLWFWVVRAFPGPRCALRVAEPIAAILILASSLTELWWDKHLKLLNHEIEQMFPTLE